jgi:ATP-binding protein involved in chromosome partitioning
VDNGRPTVEHAPAAPHTRIYREVARRVAAKLALRARDYSGRFPNIVIQKNT